MDNSLSDMFSTSDIFDTSNITINNEFEHLRIMFEEVLCTVSYIDVEENLFKDEIPKLKIACVDTLQKINEHLENIKNNDELLHEIKLLIQQFVSLLNFAHEAVKYINTKLPFIQVRSLPLAVGEILFMSFKHCKDSEHLYGSYFASLSYLLKDLFKKANELQNSFLALLNNLLIFDLSDEKQILFLVEVSEYLSTIGEIVSNLDIKTRVELWKAYLVFSQKYNEYLKTRINIGQPLTFLCLEIIDALESVENLEGIKNVEKVLKITNFNLKLVIKLCELYDNFIEAVDKLFELLLTLNRYSIPFLQFKKYDQKLIDLMQVHVIAASNPLLRCLIKNREFIQHYFKNIKKLFDDENLRLAATFLSISIIKRILTSDLEIKQQWISDDISHNIIIVIFSSIELFHVEFSIDLPIQIPSINGEPARISSFYEYLLTHLATAIISVNIKQCTIQKMLFQGIMQLDLWKAMISSDIWCIIARYGSVEFCYNQLLFLIKVFLKLENYYRIEIKYLSRLICRLYCLLSNKYKTMLVNQYPYENFLKLWSVIGIKNELILINKINNILDEATKKIDLIFTYNANVKQFESLCDSLELLSTYSFVEFNNSHVANFANRIVKLWSLNIDVEIQEQIWLLKFVRVRSEITSFIIEYFTNEDILKILQSLSEVIDTNIQINLTKCIILKSLASKQFEKSREQKQIFDEISSLFSILLKDKNPIVKQRALETFYHFAHQTSHENILANIADEDSKIQEISNYLQKITSNPNSREQYLRAQSKVIVRHKCCKVIKCLEPQQKKKKLSSDVNVPVIVKRLKFDCDALTEYYKMETMQEDVLTDLTVVVSKLQNLLKKK